MRPLGGRSPLNQSTLLLSRGDMEQQKHPYAPLLCASASASEKPEAAPASEKPRAGARKGDEHGIPRISKDPTVSAWSRKLIAVARTSTLCLLLGSTLAALWPLWAVHIYEAASESSIELSLDLCGTEGPRLSGSGVDPGGFVNLLRRKQIKVLTFHPRGAGARNLSLPTLSFFQSEEFLASGRERPMGLSFGSFKVNEMRFSVALAGPSDSAQLCAERLARHRGLGRRAQPAVDFFGQAVVAALVLAGRRVPQDWLMTVPQVHGALLVWRGPEKLWSQAAGRFTEVYRPSPGWLSLQLVVAFLRLSLAAAVLVLGGKFVHRQWERCLEVWVVQYDYLWEHAALGWAARCQHHHNPDLACSFRHRYQACSLFFVFDHIIGDPQTNSEDWCKGIWSAAVDGVLLMLPCVLPIVHALFFCKWKLFCWILVSLHLVFSMTFGAAYYFRTPYVQRQVLFKTHAVCSAMLLVYGVVYFCSVVLFMASRLIVNPSDVCGYAVALGTVISVTIVAFSRLSQLRDGVVRQMEGSSRKGEIIKFLGCIGLDYRTIFFSIVGLVVLVIAVAAMVILVGDLYFEEMPLPDMLASCFTPISALAATIQMLQRKQDDWDELTSQISSSTLNVL
mmetsp:Transcript_81108/g.233053  ORF Transcript_81108/g.233053 Transcript_81108/m.233053 type:complete len:620 (+) Transcript_81108:47-1906(+)